MRIALLLALASCVQSDAVECADGRLCPAGLACDDVHAVCVELEQLRTCVGVVDGTSCTVTAADDGVCDREVCLASRCGDNYRRGDEECDGADLNGKTNCTELGFYDSVELKCNSACGYDRDACTGFCGDGRVSPADELCDDTEPPIACVDLGYGAGHLACNMCGPGVGDCQLFGYQHVALPFTQDVHGTADDNVYVVGQGIQHFNGSSWSAVDLGLCNFTGFASVWAIGPGDFYAGTSGATVAHFTSTGCTAERLEQFTSLDIRDIWASGPNDVHAVGLPGIYHFDGTSWTKTSTTGYERIWGSGPSDVWAGSDTGAFAHYNGTTWEPVTALTINVHALWGSSATDVYVSGIVGGNETIEHYDGTTWTPVLVRPGSYIFAGAVVNGHVIAAGQGMTDTLVIAYDGRSWSDLDVAQVFASGIIHGMWASPTSKVYMLPSGAQQVLTYAGNVRSDRKLTGTGPSGRSAVVRSNDSIYAVVATDSGMQMQVWDGTGWKTDLSANVTNPNEVWIDSQGTIYAVTATGLSKNVGGTWTSLGSLPSGTGQQIWGTSGSDLWVITSSGSTYKLEHWTGSGFAPTCPTCTYTTPMWLRDIWGTSASNIYVAGDGFVLHYDGVAWTSVLPTMPNDSLRSVWGSGPSDVYVAGYYGTVLHYDGTSWAPATGAPSTNLGQLWGTGPKDVFLTADNGFLYHFDGEHWSPVDSGASGSINAIAGSGDTTVYFDQAGGAFHLVRTRPWHR